MAANIVWLTLARKDIEQIHAYLSEAAGVETALEQVTKIVKAARLLQQHPYIGHVSDLDDTGDVLEWVIPKTHYILPYLIRGDDILILRVFDARQQKPDGWISE